MEALKTKWLQISERFNGLETRERALLSLSIFLGIYLIWDFGFYQPVATQRADLELRLTAAEKEMVTLTAEERVFTKSLQNDPGAAKKREVVRLEQELVALDKNLAELSVGLLAADKLPVVLYEVLQKSHALEFLGMQTHPVELLSFHQEELPVDNSSDKDLDREEPKREVGVFKHAVTVSFKGNYFSVIEYLKRIEALEWKIYWNKLEYEVDQFPRAQITLEVFTLSTEEGR